MSEPEEIEAPASTPPTPAPALSALEELSRIKAKKSKRMGLPKKPKKEGKKRGRPPKHGVLPTQRNKREGRPHNSDTVPDEWKPIVRKMYKEGQTFDAIRNLLIAGGVVATRASILFEMKGNDNRIDEIERELKNPNLKGLDSPAFDEFRPVIDDLIEEGRTPLRIHAYLISEKFVLSVREVETYCVYRKSQLENMSHPESVERKVSVQASYVRQLRRKLSEVWHNMPPESRWSEKMFGILLSEYGTAFRAEIETLRKDLENQKPANVDSATAEIEQKLGIVEAEIAETEAANDTPSGAEAAMGATV